MAKTISTRYKHLSIIQKILISCIVLIVTMLVYVLLSSLSMSAKKYPEVIRDATQKPAHSVAPMYIGDSGQKEPLQNQKSKATLPPTEGLSLKSAETLYLQKDFDKAYAAYSQLRKDLPDEDLIRDFLQLKMAFCREKAGDFEQADSLCKIVSKSRCPIVRAIANYHLCLFEMQKKQYLEAQIRAYKTIALISALTFDWQWTLSLQRNCQFLIAESMTRHVLSLYDADKDMPAESWTNIPELDPFINLSETELQHLLNSGSEHFRSALLSPQIQSAGGENQQGRRTSSIVLHPSSDEISPLSRGQPPRTRGEGRGTRHEGRSSALSHWSVICNGASIEELLTRFAANADLDIQWACNSNLAYEAGKDMLRKRPVTLYMSSATTQQFLTVAAGCVGLLARLDAPRFRGDKLAPAEAGGTVTIFNPFEYTSLSEHRALLAEEAVSLWQIFLLTSGDKERIGNAHFALGLLKAQEGYLTDAIAEYKLVANRYPGTPVAPYALLASSKLKVDLHDYFGAREDLKQLTEQYPDTEPDKIGLEPVQGFALANEARLYLADATMKAGLLSEAARLYCKVHNLGFSLESQRVSALGAGRCFYEEKDYENAAKWLIRYINLSKDNADRDLYLACFILGKTYLALDLPQQACKAFESALGGLLGQHVMQEYVETVSALVKVHIQQGHFVNALKLLDKSISWQLSQKESIEILLLKASTLRSMGLADEAIAVLGDKAEYVLDSQLKAKIFFEQAKCFIAKDNLELARKSLSEILVLVEPGPLAQEVRCELADVCLKLGQDSQAISICLQLLDSTPENPIKQRALNLLATTYTKQKKYDQAALALLGQSQ